MLVYSHKVAIKFAVGIAFGQKEHIGGVFPESLIKFQAKIIADLIAAAMDTGPDGYSDLLGSHIVFLAKQQTHPL